MSAIAAQAQTDFDVIAPGQTDFDVVVPTLGRASLTRLLDALAAQREPLRGRLILVHDRAGRGPAAARNAGWRAAGASWVAFLDDDVVPPPDWSAALRHDLERLPADVGATQGHVHVPLPSNRRPTDWERNVAGLERARWATADMAYRRELLQQLGGFDERFARAYREDSDLALRARAHGWTLVRGARVLAHPVGPSSLWTSLKLQRGNADDALMRRLHGRGWRARCGAPAGLLAWHLATCATALLAFGLRLTGHSRASRRIAAMSAAQTARLTWARIAPGPRDARELTRMLLTSTLIPWAASCHRLRGELRWRAAQSLPPTPQPPAAVLFDRDGTLIEDVPYNDDPALVRPMPGAREALLSLRNAGVRIAVVSNQSGIARGLLDERQLRMVNRRVQELLGPIDAWLHCPHGPEEGCDCRKPAPGLIVRAARRLGVSPARCAVIGDIGSDMHAARAAGARGVLVPTPHTRREEIEAAEEVAPDLLTAVQRVLDDAPSLAPNARGHAAGGPR